MTAAQKQEKRQEQVERLEQATRELMSSEGFRRWIETRARFHRYSISNQILIALQKPDATQVAGFRKWQELDRQVRKGEKGIRILAPITVKDEDPITGEETRRLWFKSVSVFDISQTDGEDLPEPPRRELGPINNEKAESLLRALEDEAREIGFTVEYKPIPGATGGYCDPRAHEICVEAETVAAERLRILTHELCHALGVGYAEFGRERAEVIVEAATTVALSSLGFDTSGESLTYIAAWGEQGELAALREDLAKIDEIATRVERACGLNGDEEVSQ